MSDGLVRRDEVPLAHKWRVEAIYPSDVDWEADLKAAQGFPARIAAYQGRLGESAALLAEALGAYFAASRAMEKVWVYAHLRADEDLGDSRRQSMMERARSVWVQISAASSFLAPEILSIPDETMASWLSGADLADYVVWLKDVLRGKPHTLTPNEERLMSLASEPLSAFQKVFSVLKNVELAARLPSVPDEEGTQRPLTHASFIRLLENRHRGVRKAAFDAYYSEYAGNRQTVAATLDGAIKAHVFGARARRFGSALEAAVFDDNVEPAVYSALIDAVHDALPSFYRYIALRRRLLGLDTLHMYDVYVPAIPEVDLKFDYDQAVDVVCNAVRPLGDEYVAAARTGLTGGGWVDRYENVGKRSGAYSSGCYDTMPYILLNYTGTLDAVFTLAHELGHSMHSLLSNASQPYHLADYRILVAEVASTTNEELLNRYLLETIADRATRAYLIDRHLDSFRGTLFRQTMFAEFERWVHEQVEGGGALTADGLDAAYLDLVKAYFGDTIAFDEQDSPIAWEWARIDHFFYNFYVYKYATGMASAVALAAAMQNQGAEAVARYLHFLRSGSSKYPLDLLRAAGVDLAKPEPVRSALAEFERLVGELETLVE